MHRIGFAVHSSENRQASRVDRLPLQPRRLGTRLGKFNHVLGTVIPADPGSGPGQAPKFNRRPGEGRDPVFFSWTPAFAGETAGIARPTV